MFDEGTPLFVQVADRLAGEIADGGLAEGERVPSTNELAAFYRINPATAAKGINVLADDGLLEKRRGIGMFVATGARQRLLLAPQAVHPAVRRSAAVRGGPPRDRHRRAVRPDPGSRPRTERLAITPAISAVRRPDPEIPRSPSSRRHQLAISGGTITGLLGRNGAGKTTLMRILAGQEFPVRGRCGSSVRSRPRTTRCCAAWCSSRGPGYPDIKVRQAIARGLLVLPELGCRAGRPAAGRLRLRRTGGQEAVPRDAFGGRDRDRAGGPRRGDPVRRALRGPGRGGPAAVLRPAAGRYAEHPRTVLLSTHLIDEVAELLEQVVMIDQGRVVAGRAGRRPAWRRHTVSGHAGRRDVRGRAGDPLERRRARLEGSRSWIAGIPPRRRPGSGPGKYLQLRPEPGLPAGGRWLHASWWARLKTTPEGRSPRMSHAD